MKSGQLMRVMLDTNVLISAIIFPNDRMNSLVYKATLEHQLVLSSYIIDELLDVIERKFPAKIKDVELFVTGDDDFDEVEIDRPKIITPSEFLEKY
jgi:predicted nucleic acid-binding protein